VPFSLTFDFPEYQSPMSFEATASQKEPFSQQVKRFPFYCLVLGLLIFPSSSFAAYFSGPPEVVSALQFNAQGEVVFGSEDFSQDHWIPIDPFSGELIPSEMNVSKEENLYSEAESGGSEVDPYSDEAIEGDGPFGDDAGNEPDFEEEDPFVDEEKEIANMPDPFERWYNRPVYAFNDHFYEYFLRPVAQTYKDLMAENFRVIIRNLYNILPFPFDWSAVCFNSSLKNPAE